MDACNFDFGHKLDYDLTHVEIVDHDFAISTVKKSNLDSWQVAIKFAFVIAVAFMALSCSYYQLTMFAKPGFALLLGSNFSTSSGNYT